MTAADRLVRALQCTGLAAPVGDLDSPGCPLHAIDSNHGAPPAAQEESLF